MVTDYIVIFQEDGLKGVALEIVGDGKKGRDLLLLLLLLKRVTKKLLKKVINKNQHDSNHQAMYICIRM